MVSLLPKTMRNGSFLTTPISALLSAAGRIKGKRSRLGPLLVLLVLAGLAAGAYGYASYRWRGAERAVQEGRLEDAQRDLDFCLLLWPRSVEVHLLAARAARLRGELKDAEAHLSRCLKLNGGASEAIQLEFLLLRVQGGEIDKVVDELFYYVNSGSSESAHILDILSRAYMLNHRYGQAFACLSRWQEVDPDSPEPFRWRGWVLERMSDHDGAINEYKQALVRDPSNLAVRLRLAELHLKRFTPLSAVPILEQLRQEYPDNPEIKARLGQCRYLEGNMHEARQLLEAAEKEMPNDTNVLIHLARLDNQDTPPRLAEAEDYLRRALALDPTDLETQHQLIHNLELQGRTKDAQEMQKRRVRDEAMLRRANETLRNDPDNPVTDPGALSDVGIIFLRANNEIVGFYWLNRALKADPDYQPALKAIVDHYEKTGQAMKAAQYRQRLKTESSTEPRP